MKKSMSILGLAMVSAILTLAAIALAGPSVTITILRQYSDKKCTSGQLSLNGHIMGYTLERPIEGNIPLISAIPVGTYQAFVRLDTKDRWRIELKDVPKRGNVQIHIGNTLENSVGCVLLGSTLGDDMCSVKDSKAAFDKFKLEFIKQSGGAPEKDVAVLVVIEGAN
jgi:uncharacterized protein DUF5675